MRQTWLAGGLALGMIALLGSLLVAFASMRNVGTAAAQEPATQRVISVNGEGRVSLAPDTAVITLGVELFDPDASTAQREVERRMDAILAVFRQAGVPDQNITTVAYTIWVERDWNQPGGPVVGYRVTHLVEVRFQPVERVGEVLSRSVQAGANTIQGISFTLSNPATALRQARELAVRDARQKAEELAQLTGVRLGSPLRISESWSSPPIPVSVGQGADARALPVGETTVTVSVSIDYAMQ